MFRILVILIFNLSLWPIHTQAQQTDTACNAVPNILLIVSNGHGVKDLGCYGNTNIKTPNLDKLAAEGIRMNRAYSASASTSANYSIILTGLMNHASGQYGQANGTNNFSVFPEIKSLPHYLSKAGYRTARIGNFPLPADSVFLFDSVFGQDVNYRNSFEMAEHCSEIISEKNGKPFFLLFCPADPDRSYDFMDELKFGADRFGCREGGYEGIIPKFYKPEKMELPSYLPDIPESREEYAQYAQAVTRLDLGIGRLLDLIRKSEQWDRTLIIYLSSNGPYFPSVQNNLSEAVMHLPLIIKPPHYDKKSRVCNAMVSYVDLTPTILNIAEALPDEYKFHGRSFSPIMMEENPTGWDEIYASHTFHEITMYYPMRAIQTRQYKLIWNIAWQLPFPLSNKMQSSATWHGISKSGNANVLGKPFFDFFHRPEFELYDLLTDPFEMNNQASNPAYQHVLEELKLKLKNFQVCTNDPWIVNWIRP